MQPAKQEVENILRKLPEEATLEDIQYHIYIRQKVDKGLKEIEEGKTFSEVEFDTRMSRWLAP